MAFDPDVIILYFSEAFSLIKFKLLMGLSAALLVAVLGATLSAKRFMTVPVLLPSLVFLCVSTLSTFSSDKILHSLLGETRRHDGLLSLAAGVLLFYAAARFLDSWAKVRIFVVAGVTSAIIIATYGIVQHFGMDPVPDRGIPWYSGVRAFSTLGHPIWLAAYLTLMMGAALILYFRTGAKWERWLWLAAIAVMAACWLYTSTRGAMLGVGVAGPMLFLLAHRRFGSVRPMLLPVGVVVVALILAQLANPQSTDLFTRFDAANLATSPEEMPEGGDLSVMVRLLMWRDSVPVILERPLIGHGPDSLAEPFKRYEGEDLRAFFPDGQVIDKAHNELLQVAATTGLLGLAAYLWIFVSYFRHAYKSGGWPLLAPSGGVLAYILQLQTAFTTIATGVTFWAILGVTVAIMRIQERETPAALREQDAGQQKAPGWFSV
ncbi:hypothetical protein BH23ACT11_BH23ACT11_14850 [soil metagenome]